MAAERNVVNENICLPSHEYRFVGSNVSPRACYQCKRRKVRCDKSIPSCGICRRNMQECRYPSTSLKRGPKLGSHQKRDTGFTRSRQRKNSTVSTPCHSTDAIDSDSHLCEDIITNTEFGSSSHVPAAEFSSGNISNWILHHFHEEQAYQEQSTTERGHELPSSPESLHPMDRPKAIRENNLAYICHFLRLTKDQLFHLTDMFFCHLTSISLFHRPTFEHRIFVESTPDQSVGLLAAMFSLSARHGIREENVRCDPARFYEIASRTAHAQLQKSGDGPPPFVTMQTLIITTYYELIRCVRGVAWRSLGAIIRLAYELNLHLVDLPLRSKQTIFTAEPVKIWVAKEERRRAWWAVWELEVFATTIRRSPFCIDPIEHATLLPVDDSFWFGCKVRSSCFLELDPVLRWKELQKSGNESGKAWFIVINSLMQDAHQLTTSSMPDSRYPQTLVEASRHSKSSTRSSKDSCSDITSQLEVLDKCVSSFATALPQNLQYHSEPLFSVRSLPEDPIKQRADSDKQSMHTMVHLAKLMILHENCFRSDYQAPNLFHSGDECENSDLSIPRRPNNTRAGWSRYLQAADQVVGTIRNASPDHICYGHPLLANTFWIVASIQIVQKTFGKTNSGRMVAQSNFDLLRLTLDKHRDFWNTSSVLTQNLGKLEKAMNGIKARMPPEKPTEKCFGASLPIANDEITSSMDGRVNTNAVNFGVGTGNCQAHDLCTTIEQPISSSSEYLTTLNDNAIYNRSVDNTSMNGMFTEMWECSQHDQDLLDSVFSGYLDFLHDL